MGQALRVRFRGVVSAEPLADIAKGRLLTMRIAVISDVHGNNAAFKEVISDIKKQGINHIVFLGDLVMVGPEPNLVINMLKALNPLCWLKGNTDIWLDEMSGDWAPSTEKEIELDQYYQYAKSRLNKDEIEYILGRPITKVIEYMGNSILCVHGSPRAVNEIMDYRVPLGYLTQMIEGVKEDIIICGHSHVPYVGEHNDKYIFNVGSIGKPLDGDNRASYGIISLKSEAKPEFEIRRIHYPIPEIVSLAKVRDFPYVEKFETVLTRGLL